MNKAGKTLTILLVVIIIILLSLSAITLFFLQKETDLRKTAETNLEQLKNQEAKIQAELKEAKRQVLIWEDKNKEADERINSLMDDLELEQGLREEMKRENESLREALESENKSKEDIRTRLATELTTYKEKASSLESQLTTEQNRLRELESQNQTLQDKIKQLEADLDKKIEQEATTPSPGGDQTPAPAPQTPSPTQAEKEIELEKIVVAPQDLPEGRVLSVDRENEFLIFNLGEKQGIVQGLILSVYRGNEYLGDVKVSRVQPEMSAADFIPPFSSQKVRKNDQVVSQK